MIMRVKVTPKTCREYEARKLLLKTCCKGSQRQPFPGHLPEPPAAPSSLRSPAAKSAFPMAEAREAKPPRMAERWDSNWKEEIPGASSLSSLAHLGVGGGGCTCTAYGQCVVPRTLSHSRSEHNGRRNQKQTNPHHGFHR